MSDTAMSNTLERALRLSLPSSSDRQVNIFRSDSEKPYCSLNRTQLDILLILVKNGAVAPDGKRLPLEKLQSQLPQHLAATSLRVYLSQIRNEKIALPTCGEALSDGGLWLEVTTLYDRIEAPSPVDISRYLDGRTSVARKSSGFMDTVEAGLVEARQHLDGFNARSLRLIMKEFNLSYASGFPGRVPGRYRDDVMARLLIFDANVQCRQGLYRRALALAQRAMHYATRTGKLELQVEANAAIVSVLHGGGQSEAAYKLGATVFDAIVDNMESVRPVTTARIMIELLGAPMFMKDYDRTEMYAELAAHSSHGLDGGGQFVRATLRLAQIAAFRGKEGIAERFYDEVEKEVILDSNALTTADSNLSLAAVLWRRRMDPYFATQTYDEGLAQLVRRLWPVCWGLRERHTIRLCLGVMERLKIESQIDVLDETEGWSVVQQLNHLHRECFGTFPSACVKGDRGEISGHGGGWETVNCLNTNSWNESLVLAGGNNSLATYEPSI